MSRAQPMTSERREQAYARSGHAAKLLRAEPGQSEWQGTARQRRQLDRMGKRQRLRDSGALTHGADGSRVRKPRRPVKAVA